MLKQTSNSEIEINEQFKKAFELLEKTNKNLFLTGKAGTGKSTFLEFFVKKSKKKIAVLAPTGVSALNVDGETIHSFFHFMPHITESDVLSKAKNIKKDSVYHKLDLIVIDEVSMVRADLLDYIDLFLRISLKIQEPFAGIQMVFIGDMYQLPPVVTTDERYFFKEVYKSPYFFDSKVLSMQNFSLEFIELEKIYRQKDLEFINLLNAVRINRANDSHLKLLNMRFDENFENSDYITLTPTNQASDNINNQELEKLNTKERTYFANIDGDFKKNAYPTEQELKLKARTKVMFLNNDEDGRWVNGTMGTIYKVKKDYVTVKMTTGRLLDVYPNTWEVKKYVFNEKDRRLDKKRVGTFTQIPLRLAWAITIHKSQGKSFDKVILDIGRGVFAYGQSYVALSRCRTFEGLVLKKPIIKQHLFVDAKIAEFLSGFADKISYEDIFSY